MQISAPFEYVRVPATDPALAGGHCLLPPMELRSSRTERLVGVDDLGQLDCSLRDKGQVPVGARTRHGNLCEPAEIAGRFPIVRRVLFVSAEAYPFVKVGGLADVSGALPKRLAEIGFDVRLVIPGYRGLGGSPVLTFDVPFGPVTERVVVRQLPSLGGVKVFTLGLPGWFDREVPYSYQDDDVMPFVLFSKAVTTLAALDAWRPHVIHCNDWHCGLVAQEARQGPHWRALERTGIVFTIHNIAYQGRVGAATDQLIGLPPAGTLLERGIAFADRVSTVSPHYMQEILTPAQGAGLDELLRARGDNVPGHSQRRRLRGVQSRAGPLDRHPLRPLLGRRQTREQGRPAANQQPGAGAGPSALRHGCPAGVAEGVRPDFLGAG